MQTLHCRLNWHSPRKCSQNTEIETLKNKWGTKNTKRVPVGHTGSFLWKYGHFLGKNTGIIPAKFRFLWFSRLFAIYCTFSESLLYHKLVWCFVLPHSSSFLRFRAGLHPQPEAPPANIFRRFSAKILHISENFCQKFCVKFYPKKRVITTFATKKRVNATFATKKCVIAALTDSRHK